MISSVSVNGPMRMSPKRKRPDPAVSIPSARAPRTPSAAEQYLLVTESPRTQVASRLQMLEIQETPMACYTGADMASDAEPASPSPRKRQRRSPSTSEPATPERSLQIRPKLRNHRMPSSPPLSPASRYKVKEQTPLVPPASIMPSTPITSPQNPIDTRPGREEGKGKAHKTRASRSADEADDGTSSAAFWQPREITGHVIDTSTPDDADGLGINGVGFQPTARMVEIRRAARSRQVSEWRAREAREQRRRRSEKRGQGNGVSHQAGRGLDGHAAKRVVRFVDVGVE